METAKSRPLISRLYGMLVLLLGLELIVGWLLQVEAMVRVLPSSNSASFNTAVGLALCGAALLLPAHGRYSPWRRAVGAILIAGGSAILVEDIFDIALGLDWVSLHRKVQDLSPRPGRVAPNTCAAMILLGMMLSHSGKPDSAVRRILMHGCGVLLLALLITGLTGLLLDPTLLYGWHKFNRMAAPTVLGLGLATLGLYAEYRFEQVNRPVTAREPGKGILLTGTLLLLSMGMASAISTAIIFANQLQQSIRDQLQADLKAQIKLIDAMLTQAANEGGSLAARPLLRKLIQRVGERHEPADTDELRTTLGMLLRQGFASLTIQWTDGTPSITAGQVGTQAELALPLGPSTGGELLWRPTGFYYKSVIVVSGPGGEPVAELTAERPLDSLVDVYTQNHEGPDSDEVVICAKRSDGVACFPSRLHPSPLRLLPANQRPRLPADDAIDGKSQVRTAQDYRGVAVVVAYAPLGNTGLAIVSKVDAVEIYKPIASLLLRTLAVLIASLAVGAWLLRARVGPLVAAIARSEARAVESERRLKSITDTVPALIGFIDQDLKYRFMNDTFSRWFGRPLSEMLSPSGHPSSAVTLATDLSRAQTALAGETVNFTQETPGLAGGPPRHLSVSYIPDRADDGRVLGFNVLAFDITARHLHEQSLTHLANHDSLTGLPNRRLFEDRLAHAMARSQRHKELVALLYLDVDHFKQINDTLGHEQGDALLRAVAQRLTGSVRSSDTVARLGGDEFVVLMEGLSDRGDALVVANKILVALRTPFALAGKPCLVSASIGVSYSSAIDDSPDRLVQRSDGALYDAKAAGRDRFAVAMEGDSFATEDTTAGGAASREG